MNDRDRQDETDEAFEKDRRDQLLSAPDAVEADADPRIEVTEHDGVTRVEVADDAAVRPGPGPGMPEADAGSERP